MIVRLILAALILFLPLLPPLAAAGERDRDALRHEVERGEARPLPDILAAVRERLDGDVVKVEVERHNGRWLYEFRIVDREGRVFEVYVNARDATIETIKAK